MALEDSNNDPTPLFFNTYGPRLASSISLTSDLISPVAPGWDTCVSIHCSLLTCPRQSSPHDPTTASARPTWITFKTQRRNLPLTQLVRHHKMAKPASEPPAKTFKGWVAHDATNPLVYTDFTPKPFTETDIEIRITHCGICGSDVHTLRSGWGPTDYPCVSESSDTTR